LEIKVPDIILLDIMLPEEDGLAILGTIRQTGAYADIPVIMVTAKTSEIDAVKGLDLGADDYITKPFGVMELVSRVKAVLRRSAKKVKTVLVYKNIELDENKHTVLVDGAEVDLTYKEYEILKHLIRNKGIVLTRDRLMEIVWGYNFEQGNRTVDVHIQSLRKKLGTAGEHIKTIRNVGYKVGE
jgi:two-component system alkaline phosphatase synthesis response regulator PhoP